MQQCVLHQRVASTASTPATGLPMMAVTTLPPACLMAHGVEQAASAIQVGWIIHGQHFCKHMVIITT
jgi:hypothetical protein